MAIILAGSTYSYSSARVKAMESNLVGAQTMQNIIDAGSVEAALSILFQQPAYKDDIAKYGGTSIKSNQIDFALSRNLAESVNKLVEIAPTAQRKVLRALVGRWDIQNIRLAIEAKERGLGFDQIAANVIDTSVGSSAIKEAMRESTVEGMLSRLAINSPYAEIIKGASNAYSKARNITDAISALDVGYYSSLSGVIYQISSEHYQSALIVKMHIDSKNIMTLIRAKKAGMQFKQIEPYLVANGSMHRKELEQVYDSARDLDEMVNHITRFDLKDGLEVYKKTGRLLPFEVAMNNHILNRGLSVLRPTILSFGTMLAYIYIKELEVRTLRIAINSKVYGIAPEDLSRLIAWKK
ncbi:MAG: V-type ATPase subunit [Candidatus Micrarchaeota archaeon]|nr:V-type ATPase subunit [Candidatus Micrarchaeota archaeon]